MRPAKILLPSNKNMIILILNSNKSEIKCSEDNRLKRLDDITIGLPLQPAFLLALPL